MTMFNRRQPNWRTIYSKAPLVVAMWAMHCGVPIRAQDFTPTITTDGGIGSGSLRAAVIAANNDLVTQDDRILLGAGTYTLSLGSLRTDASYGDLNITRIPSYGSVTILGAGAGKTIIDAATIDRVFNIGSSKVILKDLTIRNGLALDPGLLSYGGFSFRGGGIFNNGGTVTLDGVVVENCTAGSATSPGYFGQGGGVFSLGGSLTIVSSTIHGNKAIGNNGGTGFSPAFGTAGAGGVGFGAFGGGVGGQNSTISISGTTIDSNLAIGGNGGAGGNTGYGSGGAGGAGGAAQGGGIAASSGTLTVVNSTISGNTATPGNGGKGGNSIGTYAGAIGGSGGSSLGGGIFESYGTATINNSTVAFNKANDSTGGTGGTGTPTGATGASVPGKGGGIGISTAVPDIAQTRTIGGVSVVNALSTIVSNNTASVGPDGSGAFTSQGNNLALNPTGATGLSQPTDILGVDPLLAPLANNGGPTSTHALLTGSPAIDKGNANSLPTDQRGTGYPRVVGSAADIGAFEFQAPPTPPSNPPVITSGPTATPGDPIVNQVVTFMLGGTGNVTWNYGDGTTGSGSSATHQYAIPGVYIVTVTLTDPNTGLTTTQTLTVTVHGTPFRVSKATIKLKAGHDTATLTGVVHIPAGTTLAGKTFLLTLGTNMRTFLLDAKGSGKAGTDSIRLKWNAKSGSQEATFTTKISGDLLAGLKAGAVLDANGLPTMVTVGAQVVGNYYSADNKPTDPVLQFAIPLKFVNNIAKFNLLKPLGKK